MEPFSIARAGVFLLADTTSGAARASLLASIREQMATRGTRRRIPTMYFAVDNLEEYFRRVSHQAKGSITRPIETQPWGERSFYCRDPFGNKLCFVDEATSFTGGQV